MFPECFPQIPYRSCSPRVCGDVSSTENFYDLGSEFSPRMRGCFYCALPQGVILTVLPAYAGMFPIKSVLPPMPMSSPRVCGDVSMPDKSRFKRVGFSPRMRGCFLPRRIAANRARRSPRVCGDVSNASSPHLLRTQFSPRMRGCFRKSCDFLKRPHVLPAYAGMFLHLFGIFGTVEGSPRVCGDVSKPKL